LKFILFAIGISFFISHPSSAFECNVGQRRTVIPIDILSLNGESRICPNAAPEAFESPLVVAVASGGGYLRDMPTILEQLRQAVVTSKEKSGVTPLAVVTKACLSACVTLLATLNQWAKENLLTLVVDPSLSIGIHGAYSTDTGLYSDDGTIIYIAQLAKAGVSRSWLLQHEELFESNDIHPFSVNDAALAGSNIFDQAIKADTIEAFQSFLKSLKQTQLP
jgi:hypothetical protein